GRSTSATGVRCPSSSSPPPHSPWRESRSATGSCCRPRALPHELRLVLLQHPDPRARLLRVHLAASPRGRSLVRGAGLRARARAPANRLRRKPAPRLARRDLRDDGAGRAAARGRPGLDRTLGTRARHAVRVVDRAGVVLRAAVAGVRSAGGCKRSLTARCPKARSGCDCSLRSEPLLWAPRP